MKDIYLTWLLKVYRAVYNSIGVDFDSIDKKENWYLEYDMPYSQQMAIVNKVLSKSKLPAWRKDSIITSYHLGCSPNFADEYDI